MNKYDYSGNIKESDVNKILPPCIIKIIDRLYHQRHALHDERVLLVSYLRSKGYDREFAKSLFTFASDYNPGITSYQVDYIYDRGYVPVKCEVRRRMGLCDFERCMELRSMGIINVDEAVKKFEISDEVLEQFRLEHYPQITDRNLLVSLYVSTKKLMGSNGRFFNSIKDFSEALKEYKERYLNGEIKSPYMKASIKVRIVMMIGEKRTYKGCPICRRGGRKDYADGKLCPVDNVPLVDMSIANWLVTDVDSYNYSFDITINDSFYDPKPNEIYIISFAYNVETNKIYLKDIVDMNGKSYKKPDLVKNGASVPKPKISDSDLFDRLDETLSGIPEVQEIFLMNLIKTMDVKYEKYNEEQLKSLVRTYAQVKGLKEEKTDNGVIYRR